MSAHTTGPWAIDRDDRPQMSWNNHIVSVAKPHFTICFMTHDNTPENAEAEANARLIAAAPDGLAVAETTYLALLGRNDVWRVHNQHVYCALRDFIVKATGREAQDVQDDFEYRAFKAAQS